MDSSTCLKNQSFILCNIVNGKGRIFCNQPKCKEDGKELIRRWNAFEKNGIVSDLLNALHFARGGLSTNLCVFKEHLRIVDEVIAEAEKGK